MFFRLFLAAAVSVILHLPTASAFDYIFIVDTPTTTNNGSPAYEIEGDSLLTITRDGVIDVRWGEGVSVNDINNSVVNEGAIITNFDGGRGITIHDTDTEAIINSVHSSGSITTQGNGAHGIKMNSGNEINVSGTITAVGTGADGIQGLSNNLIEVSGVIHTDGNGGDAISLTDYNDIRTSGELKTQASGSKGMRLGNKNNVTNSGLISTLAGGGIGIQSGDGNTITNTATGQIFTANGGTEAVLLNENNSFTNDGLLQTIGGGASAIRKTASPDTNNPGQFTKLASGEVILEFANLNEIINNGSILTGGGGAHGIETLSENRLRNTGRIKTNGNGAHGIVGITFNEIVNDGTIHVVGQGADAIHLSESRNRVTNSGILISSGGKSIQLTGSENELQLYASSVIVGDIDLGGETLVTVLPSAYQSAVWTFTGGEFFGGAPVIEGELPIIYDAENKQIILINNENLVTNGNFLADLSGQMSGLVSQRTPSVSGLGGPLLLGYAAPSANDRFDQIFARVEAVQNAGHGAWATAFGSVAHYDANGGVSDYDTLQGGLAVGFDKVLSESTIAGVMAGVSLSKRSSDERVIDAIDGTATGAFAGIYGQKTYGGLIIDAALISGVMAHDDKRLVNDNTVGSGLSEADGEYTSFWIAPELALSIVTEGPLGWMISPELHLRYAHQWMEGYSEEGPTASRVEVSSRNVGVAEGRLTLSMGRMIGGAKIAARMAVEHRQVLSESNVDITLVGTTQTISPNTDNRTLGIVGAELDVPISPDLTFSLSTEGSFGQHSRALSGNATVRMEF